MKFVYTEKKINVRDSVKEYAEKKIGKLDRLFKDESTAYVTFSVEKTRCIVELTVKTNGMFFRVSESTSDMFASIDSAVAAIERQVRKNKTRLEKRIREGALEREFIPSVAIEPEEETEFKVVRTKRFAIKPMSVEEAILQMNLLDHEFFVFKNQDEDGGFSVVYKRKDGGYGLIETTEE
ncbi:MAG: ribosome-associated translation inhibitor RaiA [Clostridiales bacterium]|nr:ribosome-associated translation inhibitor RaiA [Clostridiales bacterium]